MLCIADYPFARVPLTRRYVLDELQRNEAETERLTLELEAARSRVRTLESSTREADKARHVAESELAELLAKKNEVLDLRKMVETLRMHSNTPGGLVTSAHTSYYQQQQHPGGDGTRVFHRRSSPTR